MTHSYHDFREKKGESESQEKNKLGCQQQYDEHHDFNGEKFQKGRGEKEEKSTRHHCWKTTSWIRKKVYTRPP